MNLLNCFYSEVSSLLLCLFSFHFFFLFFFFFGGGGVLGGWGLGEERGRVGEVRYQLLLHQNLIFPLRKSMLNWKLELLIIFW